MAERPPWGWRKRLAVWGAAGAAGAAAGGLYLAHRHPEAWDALLAALLAGPPPPGEAPGPGPAAAPAGEGREEEEEPAAGGLKVEAHFQLIQGIADNTTVPSMLPRVRARVQLMADLGSITERLREPGLSAEGKLELWEGLKVVSFVQPLSGMWAAVLLTVFSRVQLNILGRYMFIHDQDPKGAAAASAVFDASVQQRFLTFTEDFCQQGVSMVVEVMRRAAQNTIGIIDLGRAFRFSETIGILAFVSSTFEADIGGIGWSKILVPNVESKLAGSDPAIRRMVEELRQILDSLAFDVAVKAAVRQVADGIARNVHAAFRATDQLPFAKIVPLVSKSSDHIFAEIPPFVRAITQIPEVDHLCADIYSSPLPVQDP